VYMQYGVEIFCWTLFESFYYFFCGFAEVLVDSGWNAIDICHMQTASFADVFPTVKLVSKYLLYYLF
jgi:hypothetical protein